MKTYRVEFRGTAYVQADSKKKAQETFLDDLTLVDFEEAEAEAFEAEEEDDV